MSEWGEWKLDGVCSERCGGGIQSLIKYDGCGQSIVNNTRCNTDPCPGKSPKIIIEEFCGNRKTMKIKL